jgi:hypothetical protein
MEAHIDHLYGVGTLRLGARIPWRSWGLNPALPEVMICGTVTVRLKFV